MFPTRPPIGRSRPLQEKKSAGPSVLGFPIPRHPPSDTLTPYDTYTVLVGLTINVPVVYMGRYEVVLRGDYP